MLKFIKLIIYIWGLLCVFLLILMLLIYFVFNNIIVNLESKEAIDTYKYIYAQTKDIDFDKGNINDKNQVVLKKNNIEVKIFDAKIRKKLFYEIYRENNGDIVLKNSGGIFWEDYDIIYSKKLYFDTQKYSYIKNVDSNIFICQQQY